MNYTFALIRLVIVATILVSGCSPSQESEASIEAEVTNAAERWVANWSGKIDAQAMMSQYHKDMTYVWRGNSIPYESFNEMVDKYIVPASNDSIKVGEMVDTEVTVLSDKSAIVFFHLREEDNPDEGTLAISLVFLKEGEEWKVIHLHESSVVKS